MALTGRTRRQQVLTQHSGRVVGLGRRGYLYRLNFREARMQGFPPPGSFLVPGEQVLLYLPQVQLQRAGRSLIGRKDLSYSSGKTTLHLESGRPVPCDFGVTNYRVFANTPNVVRVSSSGSPLPSYDWIFDLGFAETAIAERRWVKAPATKSALGATAAFYKAGLTRKIDPSTTGLGSQYLHAFLDAASLIGSGVRMGGVSVGLPFTKHEAGIAIKTAEVFLPSQDMVSREGWGGRLVARQAQAKVENGAQVCDFAVLLYPAQAGAAPTILNLLKPHSGKLAQRLPDLEKKALDPSLGAPSQSQS